MALEGLRLGQYRLVQLPAGGGMGEVYLAEDAQLKIPTLATSLMEEIL